METNVEGEESGLREGNPDRVHSYTPNDLLDDAESSSPPQEHDQDDPSFGGENHANSHHEEYEPNGDDPLHSSSQSCPICLNPALVLVSGRCQHSLCVECMEKVLNADGALERWPPQSAADIHLSAPTLGRCPICRSELSLFEVVNHTTSEPLHPPDTEYRCDPTNRETNGAEDGPDHDHAAPPSSSVMESLSSLFGSPSPLKNAVYVPYRGRPGHFSFHWDWDKIKFQSEALQAMRRPFLNLTESVRVRPDKWRLEDGNVAPRIKFMEDGCHFHQPSRTFHATILWPKRLNGSHEWNVILGFSKDYRFLSSGRIHMKRERIVPPEDVPNHFTREQRDLCRYPMDGRWTLLWTDSLGYEKRGEVHVVNNEYKQGGWSFYLNFDDPLHPSVRWPRSKHWQWVEDGVNLKEEPLGPPAGSKIQWKTSDPRFPELFWIRQTVGPLPVPRVILFGMGQEKFLYQKLHAKTDDAIPKYNGDSVFGNVFTKRLYIGSASYHFLSPSNSFISYRHPACRDLPPLDDGTPLPTRVDFHNIQWEPEERKLTGTIEWEQDFGTSWNDNVRWTMTMYFDSQYMVILKGGIQCEWCNERRARPRPPRPVPRHRPPPVPVYVPPAEAQPEAQQPDRNEEWLMSGYGHDQVYINAAALERYRTHADYSMGENDNENHAEGATASPEVIDYKALAQQHQERLQQEGATKRSIDFLTHLFQLAEDRNNTNPIDFLAQ
jgi:Zinc finger, C3HC4 type (RING finger)